MHIFWPAHQTFEPANPATFYIGVFKLCWNIPALICEVKEKAEDYVRISVTSTRGGGRSNAGEF